MDLLAKETHRWSRTVDGHSETVVVDVEFPGFVRVSYELLVQWMQEWGYTEVET